MKKIFTILSASVALFAFANSANAQTATGTPAKETKSTFTNSKGTTPAETKAAENKQVTKEESKTSSNSATKTAVSAEQNNGSSLTAIEEYQRKIDANRDNPKFDVKKAEAELAKLKEAAGVK